MAKRDAEREMARAAKERRQR